MGTLHPSTPTQSDGIAGASGVAVSRQTLYDATGQRREQSRHTNSTDFPPGAQSEPRLELTGGALHDGASADQTSNYRMKPQPYDGDLAGYVDLALELCRMTDAGALLVMLSGPTDWEQLKVAADSVRIVVAAD